MTAESDEHDAQPVLRAPHAPRPVRESETTLSQLMLPTDANPHGNVHGGTIMKLADTAGGIAAMRHARCRVVTVMIDSMSFLEPVYVGDLVTIRARLTWTGRSSMEVEVTVEAEQVRTGRVTRTSSAYLVYVALDDDDHPCPVPPLLTETPEEQRRWQEAEARQAYRLAHRTAEQGSHE